MADKTISALSAAAVLDGTEVLPIVQGGETKKATTQAVADLATSAIQAAVNTLSGVVSNHTSAIQANSAQLTSVALALSNALSVLSDAHASLVNRVSANSGTGGGGSVTSAEAQAVSAQAQSIVSVLSAAHVSTAVQVLARAPWLACQYGFVLGTQSTTGSALVDISGLVLTVAATETWEVEAAIFFSTSATNGGLRFGISVPPLSALRTHMATFISGQQSAVVAGAAGLIQVSGNSILMSITSTPAGVACGVFYKALFNVASAGTVRFMFAGIASTAQSPQHCIAGSYYKAIRIV